MQQQQQQGTDILVQGRIVWGGVKQGQKMVYGTRNPAIDPKTQQPIIEWAFGLAIPKPSPQSNQHEVANFQAVWNALVTEAGKVGFANPGSPGFHWKFDDGDGRKPDGSAYPEHSRGCIILACKSRIPLKLMAWENGQIKQVTDDQIKCGDYVQVAINMRGHGNPNAGLYVNPSYVARFAYGEAIVNTPDPTTIFGTTPPPMPVGGSATPMGGGMFNQPAGPGQFAQNGQSHITAPNMGTPGAGQQTPQTYQPNHGVLPNQFQPQQQPQGPGQQINPQGSPGFNGQGMGGQQTGGHASPGFNPGGGMPQMQQPANGPAMAPQNAQQQWNGNGQMQGQQFPNGMNPAANSGMNGSGQGVPNGAYPFNGYGQQ